MNKKQNKRWFSGGQGGRVEEEEEKEEGEKRSWGWVSRWSSEDETSARRRRWQSKADVTDDRTAVGDKRQTGRKTKRKKGGGGGRRKVTANREITLVIGFRIQRNVTMEMIFMVYLNWRMTQLAGWPLGWKCSFFFFFFFWLKAFCKIWQIFNPSHLGGVKWVSDENATRLITGVETFRLVMPDTDPHVYSHNGNIQLHERAQSTQS